MMYLKILRDDTKKERFINVNHLAPGQIQSLAETISVCPHTIRVEIFDSLGVDSIGGNVEVKTPAQVESESYCHIPGDEG